MGYLSYTMRTKGDFNHRKPKIGLAKWQTLRQ